MSTYSSERRLLLPSFRGPRSVCSPYQPRWPSPGTWEQPKAVRGRVWHETRWVTVVVYIYTPCPNKSGYTIDLLITSKIIALFKQNLADVYSGQFAAGNQNFIQFSRLVSKIFASNPCRGMSRNFHYGELWSVRHKSNKCLSSYIWGVW